MRLLIATEWERNLLSQEKKILGGKRASEVSSPKELCLSGARQNPEAPHQWTQMPWDGVCLWQVSLHPSWILKHRVPEVAE